MSVLVGKKAPEFSVSAVVNGVIVDRYSLAEARDKNVLLFFYPLDFTFVCPTELHAFQERLEEFEARNTQVIGCSVDSVYSHLAWLGTPKNKGGIAGIEYPLLSDLNKSVARSYDVLSEDAGVAYRGLFLIDQKGFVKHQIVNDLSLGRSVDEALRVIDALTFVEKHGEVCPANWKSGSKGMKPSAEGLHAYLN
ncbi:MAG: peroxiredoxin [Chlamydiales bacterium]|nr:peroxiredoxin [Chlamydiales bacterium]